MSPFDKQQTAETIRANAGAWIEQLSPAERQKQNDEYRAEKTRRYKIRLINDWRKKNGKAA